MNTDVTTNEVLTVSSNALSENVLYEFSVTVAHPSTNRTAVASVFVETYSESNDDSLTVEIQTDSNMIGAGQKLTLTGPATYKASEGYSFLWRAWQFTGQPQWQSQESWALDTTNVAGKLMLLNSNGIYGR